MICDTPHMEHEVAINRHESAECGQNNTAGELYENSDNK